NCDHRNDARVWHRSSLSSQHVPTSWFGGLARVDAPSLRSNHEQTSASLLDHLVGAGEKRWWDGYADHGAAFRLMISSSLVGHSTGKSPGLALASFQLSAFATYSGGYRSTLARM